MSYSHISYFDNDFSSLFVSFCNFKNSKKVFIAFQYTHKLTRPGLRFNRWARLCVKVLGGGGCGQTLHVYILTCEKDVVKTFLLTFD